MPAIFLSAAVVALAGSANGWAGISGGLTIAGCAAIGAMLGQRTALGRALTGPVCAMAVGVIIVQVASVPDATLRSLQRLVIALATPLLLLSCDLREVTGVGVRKLLVAFAFGTLGTLIGGLLGAITLRGPLSFACGGSAESSAVVAALIAKNIGSGLNFIAVVEALRISPVLVATALAADNVLGFAYFPFASSLTPDAIVQPSLGGESKQTRVDERAGVVRSWFRAVLGSDWQGAAATLLLAIVVAVVANAWAPSGFALLGSTVIAVALATVPRLRKLCRAGDALGWPLLYLYFASAGFAAGSGAPPGGFTTYGPLLLFGLVLYSVHFVVLLGLGGRAGLQRAELMVASSANIGGPATASSLALAKGRSDLARPAFIVGTLGNAIGTALGLMMYRIILAVAGVSR